MKDSITIIEVAKDCGYSISTVSNYLNHKPISEKARIAIKASIEKLHYTPMQSAQNMRLKKRSSILFIVPQLDSTFWGSLINYIEEDLRAIDYSTVVVSRRDDESLDTFFHQFPPIQHFDGAIVVPCSKNDFGLVTELKKEGLPVAILDQSLDYTEADTVTSDNFQAAYDGTAYLIAKGHTRIAAISGRANSYTAAKRENGFVQCMIDHQLPIPPVYLQCVNYKTAEAANALNKMMSLPIPPTAVFALNYYNTLGCILEANNEGLDIPKDLSILSFDDNIILGATTPPMTVIAQDIPTICHTTVEMLMLRIKGEKVPPKLALIPTKFIERESVCSYPS